MFFLNCIWHQEQTPVAATWAQFWLALTNLSTFLEFYMHNIVYYVVKIGWKIWSMPKTL